VFQHLKSSTALRAVQRQRGAADLTLNRCTIE
jgi:hypothetical protein